jgi:predicted Fe-Mo cluster-binding NifX family protein
MVCVTIPTDDEKTVKLGHFGDARYYLHFVKEKDSWKLVKKVENPFKEEEDEHEHGVSRKRKVIVDLNDECDIFVYTVFGPGGEEYMKKRGKIIVRVKPKTTIEEALKLVDESLSKSLKE